MKRNISRGQGVWQVQLDFINNWVFQFTHRLENDGREGVPLEMGQIIRKMLTIILLQWKKYFKFVRQCV